MLSNFPPAHLSWFDLTSTTIMISLESPLGHWVQRALLPDGGATCHVYVCKTSGEVDVSSAGQKELY